MQNTQKASKEVTTTPFSQLADILELQGQYIELIEENKMSVPHKYRWLNDETAHWCVDKLKIFNKKNKGLKDVRELCFKYLEKKAMITMKTIERELT